MSFKDLISNNNNSRYTVKYGWQALLGDSFFTFGYINSYKEAADILVEQELPDIYIHPIMFCYRQYLELLLKNICEQNMVIEDYKKLVKSASHNLEKIWGKTKGILESQELNEQIKFIEEIVLFFYEIDPNSFTFRYEKTIDQQKRSIKDENLIIDTNTLKQYVDQVDFILRHTYDSI